MEQWLLELIKIYGSAAIPMFGLIYAVKYLLDKDKQREALHAEAIKIERQNTEKAQNKAEAAQLELLKEARSNAQLGEELKRALEMLVARRV